MQHSITYKGKEYDLCFRFRALRTIQKELKLKSLNEVFVELGKMEAGFSVDTLELMVYAGLGHHDGMTMKKAIDLIEHGDKTVTALIEWIGVELKNNMSKPKKASDVKN